MKNFNDAKKGLRSSGKFPISSRICHTLPLFGVSNIASARVMMALLWFHDNSEGASEGNLIECHMSELRAAAGLADSGSYRSTRAAMSDLCHASLIFQDGEVAEVTDVLGVREPLSDNFCVFRLSPELIELQASHSENGYGMVDMSEVHRLARPIDLPVYLRFCAVRKRRKKQVTFTRDEIFCLTDRDPEGQLSGAMRALKSSIARVAAIMKLEVQSKSNTGLGREKTVSLEVTVH